MVDLDIVLKSLKSNKAMDPMGLVNELFQPKNVGTDMKEAILRLANGVKNEHTVVPFMKLANISTIYKNKGSRSDLVNDRGIFMLPIMRSIIDKLIYNNKYESIDSNMTAANVGGRKNRNIRNHLFIVYGVINNVLQGKTDPVDIGVYDIAQCFDSIWLEEAMNNLFDV